MSGVTFGDKHSYTDFNIYLTDVSISLPTPVRYKVDVPGANGSLDMTDNITPHIRYKNRNIKLSFKYAGEFEDWLDQETEIADYLHGKRMRVILDDDEDYYWDAFCTIDTFKSDRRIGTLVVNCDCFPYKYYLTENSYTVNGNGTITCVVDRMEISPAFELTAPTTVIYGDSSYVIESTQTTEKTLSGDIVSFANGTANPAVDLTVDIEAVQDRHGYDAPWVGGAGANKLPPTAQYTETKNGITLTCDGKGNYRLAGTSTSSASFTVPLAEESPTIVDGDYIHCRNSVASGNVTLTLMDAQPTTTSYFGLSPVNRLISVSRTSMVGKTIKFINFYVATGITIDMTISVSVEHTDSATDFTPYSNISPISGWNAVNVNVEGGNLWDEVWELGNIYQSNGQNTPSTTLIRSKNYIPVIAGATYYFKSATASISLRYYDANKTYVGFLNNVQNQTVTLGEDCHFIRFVTTQTTYKNDISINYPSTDTAYHPHNSNATTHNIPLGQTVYGGKLNVTTGELTITHGIIDLGDIDWSYNSNASSFVKNLTESVTGEYESFICSHYRNGGAFAGASAIGQQPDKSFYRQTTNKALFVKDSAYGTDTSAFKIGVSGVKMAFKVDSPTTVQLTPTEVKSLLGQNNIWADSGEVEVTYIAQDFAGRKFFIPDLELTEGSHSITIQGTGTTKVTYTNGRL